jgi:tRNA threonylcarbamoyladenosine biosynthesis protein TsaE
MKIVWNIDSIDEIASYAEKFLTHFPTPMCFSFEGEMGAGKTTFIHAILEKLGITHFEGSPTFAIIHEYQSKLYDKIFHMDCYRLKNIREGIDIGLDDILDEKRVNKPKIEVFSSEWISENFYPRNLAFFKKGFISVWS